MTKVMVQHKCIKVQHGVSGCSIIKLQHKSRCSISVSRCSTRGCNMMGTVRYSLKMQHKELQHDDTVQQHDVCSMMMKSSKMGTA